MSVRSLTLRILRWLALAGCVSVPHLLPAVYHWPAALAAVAIAAGLDFAASCSTKGQ